MYKSRIDPHTVVSYYGDKVYISQQTFNDYGFSGLREIENTVSFSEIGKMIEALQEIQKINYGKW